MSAHNADVPGARAAAPEARADVPEARERPIGELVKDLAGQTSTLVRQEIKLAQAELTTKGKVAGRGVGMLVAAAIAGLLALIALTAGLIAALDTGLPLWLAALIVMLLWGVVGAVLATRGRKELEQVTPPVPQTVETVKEDIQWAKTQTGSAGK
jgi:Putative Actinobacterial Holin-X, holin superfamily III